MKQATPVVRDLARRLMELEANPSKHIDVEAYPVLSVCDKLRPYMSKLVGVTGFHALFARALALAKSEANWLADLRVQADATLEGFIEAARQQPAEAVAEGSTALLEQTLGLLVTFIGEALTLRLVVDLWPEHRVDPRNFSAEDTQA